MRLFRQRMSWWAVTAIVALTVAVPSWAGDSSAGQAKNELKWGLNAAKRGYWLEALNRFQRANRLTPDRPHVLNNIAVALEAAGRFEDALLTYETALSIAPNDQAVRRNYSQFKEFFDAYIAPTPSVEGDEENSADAADEAPADDDPGGPADNTGGGS